MGRKLTPWIVTPRREVKNSRGLFSSLDVKQFRGDVFCSQAHAAWCGGKSTELGVKTTAKGSDICCIFCARDCAEFFLILTSPKNSPIGSCLSPLLPLVHTEEETEAQSLVLNKVSQWEIQGPSSTPHCVIPKSFSLPLYHNTL